MAIVVRSNAGSAIIKIYPGSAKKEIAQIDPNFVSGASPKSKMKMSKFCLIFIEVKISNFAPLHSV